MSERRGFSRVAVSARTEAASFIVSVVISRVCLLQPAPCKILAVTKRILLSCLIPLALAVTLVRCNERQDAIAADKPRLEIKASVGGGQTATIAAPLEGRIASVRVQEGARVNAGDLLVTLTNPSIDRDLAYARAQVALAEERIRSSRRPIARALVLGDSGARERAAADILKNREAKRNRYRDLYATHDVSREELENAENEYAAALRDWLAERDRAQTPAQEEPPANTSVLQLELEKARAEEAFVEDRKTQLEVKAPIAGVVTAIHAQAGEAVFTRDPLIEISNMSTVEVRGQIAPELLRYVKPGMPVEVRVFTVPPRKFQQPIRSVVPGPGNGAATIVVQLPNPDGVLQPGAQALITVE